MEALILSFWGCGLQHSSQVNPRSTHFLGKGIDGSNPLMELHFLCRLNKVRKAAQTGLSVHQKNSIARLSNLSIPPKKTLSALKVLQATDPALHMRRTSSIDSLLRSTSGSAAQKKSAALVCQGFF